MSMSILTNMMNKAGNVVEQQRIDRMMRRFETPEERKMRFRKMANELGLTHGKGKSLKKKQTNKKRKK